MSYTEPLNNFQCSYSFFSCQIWFSTSKDDGQITCTEAVSYTEPLENFQCSYSFFSCQLWFSTSKDDWQITSTGAVSYNELLDNSQCSLLTASSLASSGCYNMDGAQITCAETVSYTEPLDNSQCSRLTVSPCLASGGYLLVNMMDRSFIQRLCHILSLCITLCVLFLQLLLPLPEVAVYQQGWWTDQSRPCACWSVSQK